MNRKVSLQFLFVIVFFVVFVLIGRVQAEALPSDASIGSGRPENAGERAIPLDVSALPDTLLGDVHTRGVDMPDTSAGNASCFDYYTFGSVVTNIASVVEEAVPGTDMKFSGTMTNENAYPLVGLDLYVKIFRKQSDDPDVVRLNGHHLVAQFVAVKGLNIDAKAERNFTFQWSVPPDTIPGDYMLATYAMTGEAYNLSGLSFTNDVTGSTAPFIVRGQSTGILAWDKNQVMMNGNPFHFAAFIPQFNKDEPVTVKAPFVNTTGEDRVIALTWKQYGWDGLRESALVDTRVEKVTILAGQTRELAFVATKQTGSVTYIVADAEYLGTHSILDMRFARMGVQQVRINFPSLTTFPLAQGQSAAMFSCLHTVGPDTLGGAKLDLVLTDEKGAIIARDTYEGAVTGAMMGVKYDFTPQKDYDVATLTATLSRNGIVEDTGTVTYDCRVIDPSKCLSQEVSQTAARAALLKMLGGLVLLGVIVVAGVIYFKKRKRVPPVALFVLAALSGALFGGNPSIVRADTTSWTSGTMSGYEMLAHPTCKLNCYDADAMQDRVNRGPISPSDPSLFRNGAGTSQGKWVFEIYPVARFAGISATVNYSVDAKKGATTLVNGSSVLNIGDTITFTPAFTGTDISWVGTGSFSDSPYGQWGVDGQHGCRAADTVASAVGDPLFGNTTVHASLQIPTPAVSLRGLSNLSCVGLSCTVTGSGAITATVVYGMTTGQMYGASSKTKTPNMLGSYYDTGCTSVSTPLVDYAKSAAYSPCTGAYVEDNDIACFNNASNMKLTVDVPEKTIAFNFTASAGACDLGCGGAMQYRTNAASAINDFTCSPDTRLRTSNGSWSGPGACNGVFTQAPFGGTFRCDADGACLGALSATPNTCGSIRVSKSMTAGPQWYADLREGAVAVNYQSGTTGSWSYDHPVSPGSTHTYNLIVTDNWGGSVNFGPVSAVGPPACVSPPTLIMSGIKISFAPTTLWGKVFAWFRQLNQQAEASGPAVNLDFGGTMQLDWASTNATTCTLSIPSQAPRAVPVNGNTIVAGLPVGTHTISMTCFDATGTLSVTDTVVVNVAAIANELRICPTALTMGVGTVYQMRAFYLIGGVDCNSLGPAVDVSNLVTWTSYDPSIATVGNNPTGGRINAVLPGTTNITVSSYAGRDALASTVTVVGGYAICPTSASTYSGGTTQLRAYYSASTLVDCGNLTGTTDVTGSVTWSSSDTGVATVSAGLVTGVVGGSTNISTSSYNGVTPVPVSVTVGGGYKICPTSAIIGSTGFPFHSYYNASGPVDCGNLTGTTDVTGSVTWSSSNPSVATVGNGASAGVTSPVSVGSSNISTTSYSGIPSGNAVASVICFPSVSCSSAGPAATAANMCPNESFDIDDGCGYIITCNGTRTCDFNWKEVGQ